MLVVCALLCQHGGVPDAKCVVCTNCNAGWAGDLCHVPASCYDRCVHHDASAVCTCYNGGTVVASTCSCSCKTGWTGAQCNVLDAAVSDADRKAFIKTLFERSRQKRDDMIRDAELSLTLGPLIHHVGMGVTGYTGALGAPVLSFPYNSGGKNTYSPAGDTTYVVPNEIAFSELPWGMYWPQISTR